MAKIVDVTDVPEMPGAGLLHFDDGRPPLMALPEIANEHRERLGIEGDQRLAMTPQQSAGPNTTRTDAESGPGAGGNWLTRGDPGWQDNYHGRQIAPAAPAPQPSAAPAAPVATPQQAPQASADTPPPGIAAPPAAPDLSAQAVDAAKQHVAEDLLYGKMVPGSAARPAGYVPTAQKITTEAGAPYDPALAGQRIDADKQVLDAQLAQAATQKANADAMAAHAQTANLTAQQQAAKAADDLQRKQQAYQQQNQHLERELTEYTQSAQPDPDRFFKDRGVVANIFSAIGQGLGAFGASLNHTQNFAFDYVQNQIKADIAAQQAAYDGGRADRNNALARFANYYHGDIDMAKDALTIAMNKVAATETQQFAAQSQSQQISSGAAVLAAQFQKDSLTREQNLYTASLGKTTAETQDKYQTAQGASGPHRDPSKMTDAEREQAAKFLAGKPAKDQGALGMTAQSVARQKAAYSTKTEALASFADSLSHRATLMGIHFDPKTGELTNGKDKPAQESDLNIPVGAGFVGKHISGDVLTPKAMELRRAEENSVRLHAAAVYNHSISAEEGAAEVDHTIGSTDTAKLANMRYLAEEYRKRKLAIDTGAASIDPRLVNERDAAERAVNYARATGKPLDGPGAREGAANGDTGADSGDSGGSE